MYFKKKSVFYLLTLISVTTIAQSIPRFDVQGHRGARGLLPENSIPGFILALDSGVTTLELDVAITKDKQVVVSHEPWMSASICLNTDGNRIDPKEEMKFNLYEMEYALIRNFDCGSLGNERFPGQKKLRVTKPLLKDVIIDVEKHIKSFTQYEVDYNIEIKSDKTGDGKFHPAPAEFADIVIKLIDEYIPLNRVVIQSFDFRVLTYIHEKYPKIRLAALVENNNSVEKNLVDLGFSPNVYSPFYKSLTIESVQKLKEKKIRVIPWTVNEIQEMMDLKKMGVDGLITDYPDRAIKAGLINKTTKKK